MLYVNNLKSLVRKYSHLLLYLSIAIFTLPNKPHYVLESKEFQLNLLLAYHREVFVFFKQLIVLICLTHMALLGTFVHLNVIVV